MGGGRGRRARRLCGERLSRHDPGESCHVIQPSFNPHSTPSRDTTKHDALSKLLSGAIIDRTGDRTECARRAWLREPTAFVSSSSSFVGGTTGGGAGAAIGVSCYCSTQSLHTALLLHELSSTVHEGDGKKNTHEGIGAVRHRVQTALRSFLQQWSSLSPLALSSRRSLLRGLNSLR